MDLSKLFNDDRVKRFKTHIVMKSVGVESKEYRGWQIFPKVCKNEDGTFSPAHELYATKNREEMELLGWVEVKQVADPTDAIKTRKPKENVEG